MLKRALKSWKREKERRAGARAVRQAETILQAVDSSEMSREESSAAFDELLFKQTGVVAFYGASTEIKWRADPDVMVFPADGSTESQKIPSNTGLYARGPHRGYLIRVDPTAPPPQQSIVDYFAPRVKGWRPQ